ncbi:hypothetical protein GCM10023063_12770 [Arthrobacter methylotrophus]
MRHCFQQLMTVQEGRTRGETPLWTGNPQRVAGENILELTRQAMDGMPLRHYATISPVFS